jgi:Effector-associated domain 1
MKLSGLQREWVIQALLDAFPGYADFKYMVAIQLGENIEALVPLGGSLRNCVFELVVKMDARGQMAELLEAALRENPHNPQLLECQMKLGFGRQRGGAEVSARPSDGGLPQRGKGPSTIPPLPQPLRTALVAALLRLPGTLQFSVRSTLLQALPSVHTLDRNESNAKQDLMGIVDQLAHLGRTSSRQWPLLLLLDNALEYIRGYALEEDIQQLRQQLVEYYGDA